MKIMIIDDDPTICTLLQRFFTSKSWDSRAAQNGLQGMLALQAEPVDLVLLDLNLPYKSGDSVLTELRKFSQVPVIVLSARELITTKIDLLKLGADDYLTKPFDLEELAARIEAVLRRHGNNAPLSPPILIFKTIQLNIDEKSCFLNGVQLALTDKEFKILTLLLRNPTKVFSKRNIFESIWKEPYQEDGHTVTVHISALRAKLNKTAVLKADEYIETVWGIGYRLQPMLPDNLSHS